SHFNPHNMLHGSKEDEHRHVGDLGNLIVDVYGNAYLSHFLDNKIRLTGPDSIIGRAIVIHKDQDDFGRDSSYRPDSIIGRAIVIHKDQDDFGRGKITHTTI
ncbi:hypothetical protein CUMW_222340, partial [Citrus unshiu]